MSARNTSDIYARSDAVGVQGSKTVLAPAVLPIKTVGASPGDYALLFDDVGPSAVSNTYSAIGVESDGGITLKGKLSKITAGGAGGQIAGAGDFTLGAGSNSYKFSSTLPPVISVGSLPMIRSGVITVPGAFNAVNCAGFLLVSGLYSQVGNMITFTFELSLNILGAGPASFEYQDEITNSRPSTFENSIQACGCGVDVQPIGGISGNWGVSSVPFTHRIGVFSLGYSGATGTTIRASIMYTWH